MAARVTSRFELLIGARRRPFASFREAHRAGVAAARRGVHSSFSVSDPRGQRQKFTRDGRPLGAILANPGAPGAAFARCVREVSKSPAVYSPRGVCATAGRAKYGPAKFAKMAQAGLRAKHRRQAKGNPAAGSRPVRQNRRPAWYVVAGDPRDSIRVLVGPFFDKKRAQSPHLAVPGNRVMSYAQVTKLEKAGRLQGPKNWSAWAHNPASAPGRRPYCEMCGADAGKPHHDPGATGRKVTLHTATGPDGEKLRVCMLCRDGLKAMRRAKKNGKQVRRNSATSNAEATYEKFHGHAPKKTVEVVTRIKTHEVLAGIGKLIEMVIDSIRGNYRVTLRNFKGAMLAENPGKPPDFVGRQLFIEGGDQRVNLADFGITGNVHEMETLGKLRRLVYDTRKDHLGDEGGDAWYRHPLLKRYPDVIYDTRNHLLMISGGEYSLPPEGVEG